MGAGRLTSEQIDEEAANDRVAAIADGSIPAAEVDRQFWQDLHAEEDEDQAFFDARWDL